MRVGAVCDVYQPHLERAAALARRQGSTPKEVKDFREILADRSIDFVCIATPDHWHPYMMVEACKAGKDVYVEKPACVAVEEGQKMVAAARKYNRVVQAGTWQRSGDHFQRACEMVRTGVLGKVTACKTWMYQNLSQAGIGNPPEGRPPAGLDWDLWLGPAPERQFQPNRFGVYPNAYSYFRFFWDYAGGILTDSGIHMIDIVHMALGDVMPGAAAAFGGKLWLRDDSETPDTMMVAYEYPGFLCSWEHRTNNMENANRVMAITFHGDKGTLYLDRALFRLTPEKDSGLKAMEVKRGIDGHPAHWTNFLDCVRTRKRPEQRNRNLRAVDHGVPAGQCLSAQQAAVGLGRPDENRAATGSRAVLEAGLPRAVEAGSVASSLLDLLQLKSGAQLVQKIAIRPR